MLARELARVHRLAADALLDALGVLLGLIDRRLALLELLLERALLLERLVPSALERAQVVHRERDRHVGELGGELLVGAGAPGLARERPQLALHLGGDVLHAREMLVHALELARAFRLALLVLEHARRLLDERAAVLGLGLQDGIQVALADDGMRILAQARIVQDVEDVHAAGGGAVDQVLALARAVHAARDGDLGVVDGQRAVGVVEHEVDLGEPDAFARRRSGEDDVLHRLAAQVLGVALAEHPQNGVGDVRFARAVGSHDRGDAGSSESTLRSANDLNPFEDQRLEVHRAALLTGLALLLGKLALGLAARLLLGLCGTGLGGRLGLLGLGLGLGLRLHRARLIIHAQPEELAQARQRALRRLALGLLLGAAGAEREPCEPANTCATNVRSCGGPWVSTSL